MTYRLLSALTALWILIAQAAAAEAPIISALDAEAGIADGTLIVLDIRSPEEWAETGVAEGAWPVSMHVSDFGLRLQQILAKHPPERIALICATGGRSAYIADALAENGITGVIDISEGMMGNPRGPGWIARGMAVQSAEAARAAYEAAFAE